MQWLPKIPAHWKPVPAKALFRNISELRHEDDPMLAATQKYGLIEQAEYMRRENRRIVLANDNLDKWLHVEPNDFIMTFRQLMYLLGYISLFENDDVLLEQTLQFAHLDTDDFFDLYHALKEINYEEILRLTRKIYNSAFLIYLRGFFRRNYDRRILPDDELENITADNCDEYKAILDQRQQEFAA